MDDEPRLSDADLDRLFAGKAPLGADEVPGLRQFFQDLRSQYLVEAPPTVQQAHLTQIVNAARLHSDQTKAPWAPAAPAGRPGRPPWRRKIVLSSLFGSVTAKVLTGVVAAAAATGGLAAAGALPAPVQNVVASAAGGVGVTLPNPQASASAASAQLQAQKVAATVTNLVQQVTSAAQRPQALTQAALQTTGTCAKNVSTIAAELGGTTGLTNLASAQSLAARATALAQESVGCGLPDLDASATTTAHGTIPAPIAGAGQAIAGAIQGCSAPLTSAIQTLVQAALAAKTPAEAQALTQDAKTVAAAAETCAQDVATALKNLMPVSGLPTSSASSAPKGLLSLIPGLPAIPGIPVPGTTTAPTVTTPATGGTTGGIPSTFTDPSAWLKLLSSLPSGFTGSGAGSATGGWSGLTGSWSGSGGWTPYAGSSTGGSVQAGFSQTSTSTHHH